MEISSNLFLKMQTIAEFLNMFSDALDQGIVRVDAEQVSVFHSHNSKACLIFIIDDIVFKWRQSLQLEGTVLVIHIHT